MQRVTDIMAEISGGLAGAALGIEQVNQTVMQMDETTQQNAALVEEASAAARSMEEQPTFGRGGVGVPHRASVAAAAVRPMLAAVAASVPPVRRVIRHAAEDRTVARGQHGWLGRVLSRVGDGASRCWSRWAHFCFLNRWWLLNPRRRGFHLQLPPAGRHLRHTGAQEMAMKTSTRLMVLGTLLAASSVAGAQNYGPRDEGRKFNDGSRVVCKNVEVQRNTRDPTASPAPLRAPWSVACWATRVGGGNGKKLATVAGAVAAAQPDGRSRATISRRPATVWSSAVVSASTADPSMR